MRKVSRYAELKRLYFEENLHLREIAPRFGVSHQTVLNRLNQSGVRLRNRGTVRPAIERDVLEACIFAKSFQSTRSQID